MIGIVTFSFSLVFGTRSFITLKVTLNFFSPLVVVYSNFLYCENCTLLTYILIYEFIHIFFLSLMHCYYIVIPTHLFSSKNVETFYFIFIIKSDHRLTTGSTLLYIYIFIMYICISTYILSFVCNFFFYR